jgi:hypothetical protein
MDKSFNGNVKDLKCLGMHPLEAILQSVIYVVQVVIYASQYQFI